MLIIQSVKQTSILLNLLKLIKANNLNEIVVNVFKTSLVQINELINQHLLAINIYYLFVAYVHHLYQNLLINLVVGYNKSTKPLLNSKTSLIHNSYESFLISVEFLITNLWFDYHFLTCYVFQILLFLIKKDQKSGLCFFYVPDGLSHDLFPFNLYIELIVIIR